VERSEADAIYEQGREVVVAVLLRMDEQIAWRSAWRPRSGASRAGAQEQTLVA
jgi:hypothetical protein